MRPIMPLPILLILALHHGLRSNQERPAKREGAKKRLKRAAKRRKR